MRKRVSLIPAEPYSLDDLPAFMTIQEISQVARCSTKAVRTAIKQEKLKAGRVGRLYRINREDFIDWLKGGGI
mgnify:CR=1 FL=1